MQLEVGAAAAMPHAALPPAVRTGTPPETGIITPVPRTRDATFVMVPPRRVELSFHEDLRVLMTRVIDTQTGDLVREYPARQVLDVVADVMKRMRARMEG